MISLEEAIKHCEEVAEENQAIVDACDYYGDNMAKCEQCANEHRQLAKWLKELQELRREHTCKECRYSSYGFSDHPCSVCRRGYYPRHSMTDYYEMGVNADGDSN